MSVIKNDRKAIRINLGKLFVKHNEIFEEYHFCACMRDYIIAQKHTHPLRISSPYPIFEFLNGLSLRELKVLAVIKHIGEQATNVYEKLSSPYANYQHYIKKLDEKVGSNNRRQDYINILTSTKHVRGDGFVFKRGLNRLGITAHIPDYFSA